MVIQNTLLNSFNKYVLILESLLTYFAFSKTWMLTLVQSWKDDAPFFSAQREWERERARRRERCSSLLAASPCGMFAVWKSYDRKRYSIGNAICLQRACSLIQSNFGIEFDFKMFCHNNPFLIFGIVFNDEIISSLVHPWRIHNFVCVDLFACCPKYWLLSNHGLLFIILKITSLVTFKNSVHTINVKIIFLEIRVTYILSYFLFVFYYPIANGCQVPTLTNANVSNV